MHQLMTQPAEIADRKVQPSEPCAGPLFVVGMFRSGTSLLYALLNQHPQIALMYEGDLAHLPSLFWLPTNTRRWLARWEFWNGSLSRHKVDLSEIPEGISDLKTAFHEVYVQYAQQKKSATVWGCKSPTYSDQVSRLARIFPNARFIIIWRDLRGICRSIRKAAEKPSFFRRTGVTLRTLIGYRELKAQCDEIKSQGVPIHQMHYEDLVADPTGTMQGICEFLQIPFDPQMASLEGADRSAIENAAHHSLVKTEKIIASETSASDLPPALKEKIDRYLYLWHEQNGGSWPVYPRVMEATTRPSLGEQVLDRARYKCLQLWYHGAPVAFSFVPLRLWKAYRKLMGRPYARELDYRIGTRTSGTEPVHKTRTRT
ncbi:MAG: sulfotransferase [Terriglobales bacterium]